MLKRHSIYLLLAAMMVHLAACSFTSPSLSVTINGGNQSNQTHSLLTDRQTHKILKKWSAQNYRTDLPDLPISLTNKHQLALSFHSIISGYQIATFCHRTAGIGLPVVIQTEPHKFTRIAEQSYQSNIFAGSLIATQSPTGHIHLTLLDPRVNHSYYRKPLKTQHNLVIDHVTNDPNNKALSLRGLLNPLKYQDRQGFYLSRPYDKNKIPIIMIHGIFSSPETFNEMAETIESQPDLFTKYQIWHYYYPTGNPWLVTAHKFRTSYRQLLKKLDPHGTHPNIRKTTIVAHSMGGLITRLSLSQPKNHLTNAYLGKQGTSLLSATQKQKLQPYFHYQPITQPKQIIFLAVPHQGSRMATGFVGWVMDKLIAIPNTLIKETQKVLLPQQESNLPKHTRRLLTRGENAVYQLQPKNPAIQALNKMKLPKKTTVHTIVGDIGLPAIYLRTDGVVSYKSAHLPRSNSEAIIPSNHDITDAPKSIQRVIEILRN